MKASIAILLAAAFTGHAAHVTYAYDELNRLVRVDYGDGRAIAYTYDKNGNLLNRSVAASAGPSFTAAGVLNAANNQGGGVSPGEIVVVYGSAIGPAEPAGARLTPAGLVDNFVSETRVFFDDIAAPLIYVSAGQTSAVVPYSVAGKTSTRVQIEYRGARSPVVTIPVVAAAPGIFTADFSGAGEISMLNQDETYNSPTNPAAKNSVVVFYATGEGQTDPPGTDGLPATTVFPKPVLPVIVTIGGVIAVADYTGAAPNFVAGAMQLNVRVPAGAPSGPAVPVVVTVGTFRSQTTATMAIQ